MRKKNPGGTIKQIALGLELPFMLVGPPLLAGAIGFFIDRWLHTTPILMIVFGFLGAAIGIWDVMKVAAAEEKKNRE